MNRSWLGVVFCVALVGSLCLGDAKKTKEEKEAEKAKKKAEKEEKRKLAALYGRLNLAVAKYLDDCNNVCKAWDSGYDFATFCKYLDDRKASRQKLIDAAAAIPEGDDRVKKLLDTCDEVTDILNRAGRSDGVACSKEDKAKIKALRKKLKSWRPVLEPPPTKRFAE